MSDSWGGTPPGAPWGGWPSSSALGPDRRPGTVTAAGIITLVSSGLVAILTVLGLVAIIAAREATERRLLSQPELEQAGLDAGDAYVVVVVVLVVLAVWSLAACALGALVLRRSQAGRILLVISASAAALLSLLGIASLVTGLPLLAAILVMVLLFTGGANQWFARGGQQPSGARLSAQHSGQDHDSAQDPYGAQPPQYPGPTYPGPTYPGPTYEGPRYDGKGTKVQRPWGKRSDRG